MRRNNMPLKKVKGGYKYGSKGKVYKQRSKYIIAFYKRQEIFYKMQNEK